MIIQILIIFSTKIILKVLNNITNFEILDGVLDDDIHVSSEETGSSGSEFFFSLNNCLSYNIISQ